MKYKRILITDDSATSRMIIKRCIEMAGFFDLEYFEAEDGLQGLTILDSEKVDLIITDLKMPKMGGKTFIRKLKSSEDKKDIPIVVVSSLDNEILEARLKREGVLAVIGKPLSPAKVFDFMEETDD
ncbi:MAG: response regulator [Spirochaetia bacterium]|jgi:two-component system chemotaxis response regulator CheY|nr:response regulator [Spirochaetia bacterium]